MANLDERQSQLLKALADETRLRLVRVLSHEVLNVQELCEILELPQPRVSRHLSVLRSASVVRDQREGSRVYYRLADFEGDLSLAADYVRNVAAQDHPDVPRIEQCVRRRAQLSHEFASRRAHEWDEVGMQLHSSTAAMVALAELAPRGLRVADLGTGTGLLLPILSSFADTVFAIDQSAEMIDFARERCVRNALRNVTLICDTFENLPQALPEMCDCAIMHFVLHQTARPVNVIGRAVESLLPGGRLVIVDRVKHEEEEARAAFGSLWLGFTPDDMKRWLTEAGLTGVTVNTLKSSQPRNQNGDGMTILVAAGGKAR